MRTSYLKDDVEILLKDISGMVEAKSTKEREKLIQEGVHYSKMLPIEYKPSDEYMKVYKDSLRVFSKKVADAIGVLSDKIIKEKSKNVVLVSLARAGIPAGILIKRYIKYKYDLDIKHYSVSIIRGRGIDKNAINYILSRHIAKEILFVDGWTGKGAIMGELKKDVQEFKDLSDELAVICDPANITNLCGTKEDILIPSSCLNATVSVLISRTFLRDDIIGKDDFHGAVYYENMEDEDLSYDFINSIQKHFTLNPKIYENEVNYKGIDEVKKLAQEYDINDINLIKPSIGEATRVLLRRVPWKILIDEKYKNDRELAHLISLAKEKNVPIEYKKMQNYKACGIIKNMADI